MESRRPPLKQAVADANGFTLYSCSDRIWIRLAGFFAAMLALDAAVTYEFPLEAIGFLLLSLVSAATAGWLARSRFEFILRADTRVVTVVEVRGFFPARRHSFGPEEVDRVEFGPCRNGRQKLRFVLRDPQAEPIVAILVGAREREGDLAASIRKTLAAVAIRVDERRG